MQEEVENRTLTLVVSGTKFTGRLLKAAISKYMAHCKEKKLQKSTPAKRSRRPRKRNARLCWQNSVSSKRWSKMPWWTAPSERSWNDEKAV